MFQRFTKAGTHNPQTPSTSDSPTHSAPTCWDVFLSFRGEDTRNNFTDHLHQTLLARGIQAFKDDLGLHRGEVISDALLAAIRESKTYVVVLSENFASSTWCLNELVEILNCCKTTQRLVIPVFYRIDPTVVRRQTGSFEKAFKKHRTWFGEETEKAKNWRLALKEIANFSGYHISINRGEASVIKEIVDELLLKINPKTMNVTRYAVGLDSRVKDIATLLSRDTEGVTKFGIYGMGGVGKTTLAKAVYNQLLESGRFKGSCFLADVRETSQTTEGLVSLQKQLIVDVHNGKTKVEVHNVDQGITFIRERISSAKVLVLIDDIYDLRQYKSLAGPFASGSVVIITTRDEEMLEKLHVEPEYRYLLKVLNKAQSRELFTKYAFEKAERHINLLALTEDILDLASGLPLALKIFGSHLSTKKEEGWKSYIETLRQHPNSTVGQKLVISLDALHSEDPMLKEIFLDIACFFIGWKKENAVKVMETSYSYTDVKIDTLKKRCLLTVNDRDELEMHDLLRDTGRNVARNNASTKPGEFSRLWLPEDILDVLKNHRGTEAIEAIIPHNLYFQNKLEGQSFTTETFKQMSKLRFLCISKVNLSGSFEQIFEDLRVLVWDGCPLKYFPSDFYPEKLVILELGQSNMRTLWSPNMVSNTFKMLKTLNMSYSQDLVRTPDFGKLPCLETLNFESCENLKEVDKSIGSLDRLVSLNLMGCVKLRCLPFTICNLRALEVLTTSWCSNLEALPIQMGYIESLTKLDAGTLNISRLPDSIGNFPKLVKLNLSNNKNLETLPDTIGNLRSLENLNIDSCSGLKALPSTIGEIETLKRIHMRGLTVSNFPDSIGKLSKLVNLDLSRNPNLETLPDTIGNLTTLESLDISACGKLETLPDHLWMMSSLTELDASFTTLLKELPDVGSNQIALSLQNLKLSDSGIIALPSGFSQLSNLESLVLSCCDHLVSIPKLPPSLKHIDANNCKSLERLPNLCDLKQLEKLNLRGCRGLKEILVLKELTALRELDVTDCTGLTEIQGLAELTSIRTLGMGGHCCLLAYKHLTKRLFQVC
ncbi:hypothetical protein DCAR_0622909 [Daucus carota subsp. sativus]|uniref:TIR domain-containing protein n=1 Tax=Daucus carota subsp. sativus TaxID=79200 RepID=A0AAF0X8N9_DAUCS|nr:hypothetical protein DCAR_0622909 [Daucus carota subsp. sativus]